MADSMIMDYASAFPGKTRRAGVTAGPRPAESRAGRDLYAIVLAGGEGRRLQGFVRQFLGTERPKQFCRITGTRSMLRHTWDRAARLVEPDRIVTVITAGQEPYLEEESGAGVPGTILVQPENKETAAGLLLPLLWVSRRRPTATVAVFPADHFIWEEDRFAAHVRAAVSAAQEWPDRLVLLGVEADAPEAGYGWIAPGEAIAEGPERELYTVRRFQEKPDREMAARLLARGHLWNTMVMVGRVSTYLELAAACIPYVLEPLRGASAALDTASEVEALHRAYSQIASTNFSRAVLGQSPQKLMVLAARGVAWSDWGEPHHIVKTLHRFDRPTRWLPSYTSDQRQPTSPAPY